MLLQAFAEEDKALGVEDKTEGEGRGGGREDVRCGKPWQGEVKAEGTCEASSHAVEKTRRGRYVRCLRETIQGNV